MTEQLEQIAIEIKARLVDRDTARKTDIENSWHIGRLLLEAKELFDTHVAFGKWAQEAFGFTGVWRWKLMRLSSKPLTIVKGYKTLSDALAESCRREKPKANPSFAPYYGPCEVHIGDNLDVLPSFADGSIDLIVTSPPYADLRSDTPIHPNSYVQWFVPMAREFLRVLKPTGSFILNIGDKTVGGWRHPYVYQLVLALTEDVGFKWAETYFWCKDNAMPGDFGKRASPAVEYIYWFAKGKEYWWSDSDIRVPYKSKPHLGKPKSLLREPNGEERDFYQRGGALPPNYFTWPKAHVSDGADKHTAVYPAELPEWFILAGCPLGGIVMDPFAGSGTTGVAANRLGRKAILIERNPAHEATIHERLNTAQQRLGFNEEASDADESRT